MKEESGREKKLLLDQLHTKDLQYEKAEALIKDMEKELDSSRMIQKAAEVQANRDLLLREKERETENIKGQFRNLEGML